MAHKAGVTVTLQDFFARYPRVAIALSGGVDSTYLLCAAVQVGAQVQAYFVRSAFQPPFEAEDACRAAKEQGVPLRILDVDVLSDNNIANNPENRCYFCKKRIFKSIFEAARADGLFVVLDGTNASDCADDRPGMAALAELGVRSPLRECGLTKQTVRRLAREAGLFTSDKPAYACLATRIPAGTPLTPARLAATQRAEETLAALGLADFRVRLRGADACIQLRPEQLPLLLAQREKVLSALKKDYEKVCLDLEVRP